jgi:scyllo-inositol 2-dehydrogenase (NADP+)
MKTIVVGLGNQGIKRQKVAGTDCVATVDPYNKDADYQDVREVSLDNFDSALLCLPDEAKFEIIKYLLENKKHILVEKPLYSEKMTRSELEELRDLAIAKNVSCYTAYNHRFEPNFMRVKTDYLDKDKLGKIHYIKMFYGNGTARLVRDSDWRDKGMGVLPDLSVHMIDILKYWDIPVNYKFKTLRSSCFENRSFDHVLMESKGDTQVFLEMSLLSWKNHFVLDIIGEKGSLHMRDFCKWGPSSLVFRERVLPSGRPKEESFIEEMDDPTWRNEYQHFKEVMKSSKCNIDNDLLYFDILKDFEAELL